MRHCSNTMRRKTVTADLIDRHMHVNMTAPAVMIRSFTERIKPVFPDTRGVVINITDAKLAGLNLIISLHRCEIAL